LADGTLRSEVTLRPATAADFPSIRALIRRVRINPTGLDWRRFLVAVDSEGRLLACGQLKTHGRDVVELASIAVEAGHRSKGLARLIIERLIAEGPRPLYLTCRSSLGPLYEKWGFRELQMAEMPRYFHRLARVMSVITGIFPVGERLLVMVLQ
jgi:N-acetylglutamate synthase-like GNAT family acetyltransferase